ncbi:MAG: TatD family hydrolase [Proteobacteria bacterium]|nr:TatD family hydrolase [Pseudomonadota bacterium]
MFVDSHCHLEMETFEQDRDKVIEKSIEEGLDYILTVGTEERYFERVVEIIEKYDNIYGAISIHPHNSSDYTVLTAKTICQYLTHKKIVAYGEIGLDFFRNYSPRDTQIQAFRDQLIMAKSLNIPVIIHSRHAKDETLSILQGEYHGNASGVIHCYSYDLDTAKKLLDMGFYISIPGTITYTNTQKAIEVVKNIPMDRLLAETDAPFLTPVPQRGKRNEPHFVKYTIARLAQIKNKDIEDVASNIRDNFVRLFLGQKR